MSEMPLEDVPGLADLAHEAAEGGQVVYLTEGGKRLVAIVPAAMAAELEAEDAADIEAARASLAEPGENVPLEDVLRELGV
jgi:hypothetical protein